ncbi:Tropinone reductase 2 [Colletotrichum truncatum]|uniref:Tropinone reductase 2 n=1 Tax=Colletotrichum truncatum TaxID=5467 RepID=A0ACC3Z388_COLTU|nr:Tropinone reductase 2 [Colletotrichum truncatum]KAF6793139.1 Tropinone reductase 2 [Colletotrichum truncatum]
MTFNFTNKLAGKSVVIVGGTSGVGFAVAEGCIEFGASVVLVGRTKIKVEEAVQRLGATYPNASERVRGYACDISSKTAEDDITNLFEFVTAARKTVVDHVISTAGGLPNTLTLTDVTSDDLVAFSRYHFIGDTMLAKIASKYLDPAHTSSITFTGGAGTFKPPPGWSVWASIGGAKDALTRGLAISLAPIRVNLVSLGAIRTELFDQAAANWGKEALEASKDASILGVIGDPRDVAESYLGIIKNHFQTGTITLAEGGTLLK